MDHLKAFVKSCAQPSNLTPRLNLLSFRVSNEALNDAKTVKVCKVVPEASGRAVSLKFRPLCIGLYMIEYTDEKTAQCPAMTTVPELYNCVLGYLHVTEASRQLYFIYFI